MDFSIGELVAYIDGQGERRLGIIVDKDDSYYLITIGIIVAIDKKVFKVKKDKVFKLNINL